MCNESVQVIQEVADTLPDRSVQTHDAQMEMNLVGKLFRTGFPWWVPDSYPKDAVYNKLYMDTDVLTCIVLDDNKSTNHYQ